MDKLKDFLRQAIKYRFWIVVGVASILPVIAYFATSGPIQEATAKGATEVKSISTDVKQYTSGTFPNPDYKALVDERTAVLTKDVKQTWRMLYEQQAPLLSWPPEVENEFKAWGITQWPKDAAGNDVDDALVEQVINTYVQVYPQQVERVYQSFRPFNYEDGTGIVAAPPQDELLRPAAFTQGKPPTYGKVVAAQQKLWIQGTVLDVVDKVNGPARTWDNAPIKQIIALEVANSKAQGQESIAKGETLELAPEIVKPGTEAAAPAEATPAAGSEGATAMYMSGAGMMMGGPAGKAEPEEVYFLAKKSEDQPYRNAPVYLAVLIDQSRLLDVFEKFRNSPMSIKVADFEMKRPATRVKKPVKGETMNFGAYYMGNNEMLLGGGAMMYMNYPTMMPGEGMMDPSMYMGSQYMMGGRMLNQPVVKKGVDVRQKAIEAEKEKKKAASKKDQTKKDQAKPESTISDPYFNIVELHVYGQAKFYNPPPPDEPETAAPSESEAAAGEAAPGGEMTAPGAAAPEAAKAQDAAQVEAALQPEAKASEEAKPEAAAAPEPSPDRPTPAGGAATPK